MTEEISFATAFIEYSVDSVLAFLSHQEMMRTFTRAFTRADIKLRYSEGFNPHPKFSLPFPKTVGVESFKELAVVQIDKNADEIVDEHFLAILNDNLPDGIRALTVKVFPGKKGCEVLNVTYLICSSLANLGEIADELMGQVKEGTLELMRTSFKTGKTTRVNLADLVCSVTPVDDGLLWTVRCGQCGTAKVAEMVKLMGIEKEQYSKVIRKNITWK